MRIRMKMSVAGTFHNLLEGVSVGQIVDVDDENGQRYIDLGYAELANQTGKASKVEHAVQLSNEERAVLDTEVVGASSKPVPQPRAPRPPKVEAAPAKRTSGRSTSK